MTGWWNRNQQPQQAAMGSSALPLGLPNNQQTLPASGYVGQPAVNYNGGSGFHTGTPMGAMVGGMFGDQAPQSFAPPSDIELIAALLQTSVPVDRWLVGPNMEGLIGLIYKISSLAVVDTLRNARLKETDDGFLEFEFKTPETLPTPDGVNMEAGNLKSTANQAVQSSMMQQQQILNMVQQNMMQGAITAAMANEGLMETIGSGIGDVGRGLIFGRR